MYLYDSARASGPGRRNHSERLSDSNQDFRVKEPSRTHMLWLSRGSQGLISSGDRCNENDGWMFRHSDWQELKISSLTLEMLLRNFPMLGGYTQRVRPGAHPVLDLQQRRTFIMSTEGLRSVSRIRLSPPALGGLTEVDLCTSLPSIVPVPG